MFNITLLIVGGVVMLLLGALARWLWTQAGSVEPTPAEPNARAAGQSESTLDRLPPEPPLDWWFAETCTREASDITPVLGNRALVELKHLLGDDYDDDDDDLVIEDRRKANSSAPPRPQSAD